jgi:ComF family protein
MFKSLFKPHCILCAASDGETIGLCKACYQALPWHTARHCPQCALVTDGQVCGNCLNAAPDFERTTALLTYDYPLDALLQQYKYHGLLHLAEVFAELFYTRLAAKTTSVDLIMPMPMHAQRLRERGFNQALELARSLSKYASLPLDYQSCQRVKLTPPQASLPLKERVKNVRDVFACNSNFEGLRVAIVDDVMTTGASMNALAKTLKRAGAARVECWVIARTLSK